VQALAVGRALGEIAPSLSVEYRWIESEGDQRIQASLTDIGGKGLFAHAVEKALLNKEADLAVHSLKDLPAKPDTTGIVIAAVPKRNDVRDCLISSKGTSLEQLPPNATLGTASPRRASQVLMLRPDLKIELIRGNIQSRIRKVLDEHRFDATLLAVAGLKRAGLVEHAKHPINPTVMLPAAGQGALALQCRADDHLTLTRCLPLNHAITAACVNAERQIVAGLGGSCHSPIAVWVEPTIDHSEVKYWLRARVLAPDGQTCLEVDQRGSARQLRHLTQTALCQLRAAGCVELLNTPPAR